MLKPSPAPPSLSLGRRPLIVIELSLCLSRYCELSGPGDAEHMRYCFSEYGAPGDAEARRLPTELAFVENGQDRRSALVRALSKSSRSGYGVGYSNSRTRYRYSGYRSRYRSTQSEGGDAVDPEDALTVLGIIAAVIATILIFWLLFLVIRNIGHFLVITASQQLLIGAVRSQALEQ